MILLLGGGGKAGEGEDSKPGSDADRQDYYSDQSLDDFDNIVTGT